MTIYHGHAIAYVQVIQNGDDLVGFMVFVFINHGIHFAAARADVHITIGAQRHLARTGHFCVDLYMKAFRHMQFA